MQPSITAILSLAEIFDNLTNTQFELVASICEPAHHKKGETLIQENENSDEMYIIGRGGVEIIVTPGFSANIGATSLNPDPIILTELRQGQVFGEIALVDQGVRSATARVSRPDTMILRIQRKRLMLLCDTYPELGYKIMRNLAADLALKIRNTDLTLRQYQLMLADAGAIS
ncbi:MAG: cyclic nucleotide-binding domain-containing protein [Chloroflexota bacterium]